MTLFKKSNQAMRHFLKFFISVALVLFVSSCASSPQTEPSKASNGILEPVDEKISSVESVETLPSYKKLLELLQKLGYESLGMQFETEATLSFLIQVFSSPKAANREIKIIYTGLILSYDLVHQSLTIGGAKDVNTVASFIEKKIKIRPQIVVPAVPKPVPSALPKVVSTPVPKPVATPTFQPDPTPLFSPEPENSLSPVPPVNEEKIDKSNTPPQLMDPNIPLDGI